MVSLKITQDSRKYLTVVKANQKLPINTSGSSETNPAIQTRSNQHSLLVQQLGL
jgi:hypothetical protein